MPERVWVVPGGPGCEEVAGPDDICDPIPAHCVVSGDGDLCYALHREPGKGRTPGLLWSMQEQGEDFCLGDLDGTADMLEDGRVLQWGEEVGG